jgi:hypothetical protein
LDEEGRKSDARVHPEGCLGQPSGEETKLFSVLQMAFS